MPIGDGPYPRSVLPDEHWEALYQAQRELIDLVLDNLTGLAHGAVFADLEIAAYLPPTHLHRFDARFLRHFLVCLISVGLKLRLLGFHPLGCTAEETASGSTSRRPMASKTRRWASGSVLRSCASTSGSCRSIRRG